MNYNERRAIIGSNLHHYGMMFETDAEKIDRLEFELAQLREDISLERKLRYDLEMKVEQLNKENELLKSTPTRKRRTKAEMEEQQAKAYSEYKSDGKRKAHKADSIRSYEDFIAIQNYFEENNRIRDWMMWTVGVSLGLRVSDLLNLKMRDIFNDDKTFRERIYLVEKKTSKANNCLITDSVVYAIDKYLDSVGWDFDLDEYLFISNKTKNKMCEKRGWEILSEAGKALNMPITIGSHSMRRSFANIAACVDKSSIDMNAIVKIQGLLNHSDQRVTLQYLGTYQTMFDNARKAVSDFVLGKTNVHELVAGTNVSLSDIMAKLDQLECKI